MIFKNRSRLFVKTKNIKNISIPFLFVITFILIFFNKTDYIIASKIKSSTLDYIHPITKVISYPVNLTLKTIAHYQNMNLLEKENLILKEEIIRLKKWQKLAIKWNVENSALKKLLNSTTSDIKIIKTASILSFQPNLYSKTILVNAGIKDQIQNNHIAINERGLIGKVIEVGNNSSKILLLNNKNLSVPVRNIDGSFFAIFAGSNNSNYLISKFVKGKKMPKIGEILITSGNAGAYPKNILVGKVVEISTDKIKLLPFVDINNIEFVQIINNK